jgi:hypothetical protein
LPVPADFVLVVRSRFLQDRIRSEAARQNNVRHEAESSSLASPIILARLPAQSASTTSLVLQTAVDTAV